MGLLEDWGTLIEAQQIRFGITAYDDPMEALTKIEAINNSGCIQVRI